MRRNARTRERVPGTGVVSARVLEELGKAVPGRRIVVRTTASVVAGRFLSLDHGVLRLALRSGIVAIPIDQVTAAERCFAEPARGWARNAKPTQETEAAPARGRSAKAGHR
jgi:hypothetical protein